MNSSASSSLSSSSVSCLSVLCERAVNPSSIADAEQARQECVNEILHTTRTSPLPSPKFSWYHLSSVKERTIVPLGMTWCCAFIITSGGRGMKSSTLLAFDISSRDKIPTPYDQSCKREKFVSPWKEFPTKIKDFSLCCMFMDKICVIAKQFICILQFSNESWKQIFYQPGNSFLDITHATMNYRYLVVCTSEKIVGYDYINKSSLGSVQVQVQNVTIPEEAYKEPVILATSISGNLLSFAINEKHEIVSQEKSSIYPKPFDFLRYRLNNFAMSTGKELVCFNAFQKKTFKLHLSEKIVDVALLQKSWIVLDEYSNCHIYVVDPDFTKTSHLQRNGNQHILHSFSSEKIAKMAFIATDSIFEKKFPKAPHPYQAIRVFSECVMILLPNGSIVKISPKF